MRSLIRLVMFRRYNNNNNNNGNNGNSNSKNNDDNNNTSILTTLMAIQSINARSMINQYYYNTGSYGSNGSLSLMVLNEYYNKSWNGTLGPTTESYQRMSWKGERTLSRSRLEVCPANASSIAANDKPECPSLAFAKEPTPFVTDEVFKQIPFNYLFGYQLQIDGFAFHQFDDL
jgi:hypothetical protein